MWTIIVREPQGPEVARAELKEGALVLGRGKDCGLVLPSGSVSRKHARFELRGDKLFFFDEGSANGSIVDGRRVVAPVEVTPRSAIEITPFRIAVEGGEDEEEKTVMIKRPAAGVPPPSRPASPPPPRPAAPPDGPTLSDLRPMGSPPPAPPRPAASSSDTAFTVRFPDQSAPTRPVTAAPSAAQAEMDAAAIELERHIQGIRNYREQSSTNTNTRQVMLEQGWQQLVVAMQNVHKRLTGNPRVQSFVFSRDGKEVAVKLLDPREKRGYRYFVLSRSHPEGKFPGLDVVWVCETGREDMNFRDPKDAQTEIFQRIAATLA